MEQQDRLARAGPRPVMARVKPDASRIDLRGSGDNLTGAIGNATEPTSVFLLCDVSRQGAGFGGEIVWTEATHYAVRMTDGVLAFDKAVHTVKAVSPPAIPCAIQLLELNYEVGGTRRAENHANIGTRDPSRASISLSPQLPGLRLEVAINATHPPPVRVLKRFAKIVRQLGFVPVESHCGRKVLMQPVPGLCHVG